MGTVLLCLVIVFARPLAAQQTDGDDSSSEPAAKPTAAIQNPKSKIQYPDDVTIIAEGMAPLHDDVTAAEEEAVWDAKRNAVEQAVGVVLRTHTVGRDHLLERDDVEARAQGFIRSWEKVPGSRRIERLEHGRILHIQVRAVVALMPMIHTLSDIADVYKDLERPRLRVQIAATGKGTQTAMAQTARGALVAALQEQGFQLADSGPAEVVLSGRLEVTPTVHLGDHNAPYGIGDSVAVGKAHLTLQAVSTASEDVLFTADAVGSGRSFTSDQDACGEAAADVADALLKTSAQRFVDRLLVRWAHERQEGHTICVQVTGLESAERGLLRQEIRAMRGFLQFTAESGDRGQFTLRYLTRQETAAVRRRLATLHLDSAATHPVSLTVLNDRGPTILCAAHAQPRVTSR